MNFQELQKRIIDIFQEGVKRDNIKTNDDYFVMKIGEEVGEADTLDINLEEAIEKKWITKEWLSKKQ
ncbi:MAG: hypothetical protein HYV77_01955 [Candidatus Wildermuthbacteria bacterium]|nr:hypothetical protein [Candidatus Wildermuthbacteria bacterium]